MVEYREEVYREGIGEEERRKRVGKTKWKEGMRGRSTDGEKKNSCNLKRAQNPLINLESLFRSV